MHEESKPIGSHTGLLMRISCYSIGIVGYILFIIELLFCRNFNTSFGFFIGACFSVCNVQLLAVSMRSFLVSQIRNISSLLYAILFFVFLVIISFILVYYYQFLIMGYSFGLAFPAIYGIFFGFRLNSADSFPSK